MAGCGLGCRSRASGRVQPEITNADEIADDATYEDASITRVRLSRRKLRLVRFVDCAWTGADLSLFVPEACVFQACRFEDCKAIGVDWTVAARLTACEFHRCILDQGAFPEMRLPRTVFRDCRMRDVLLAGADLTEASLVGSDLSGATFGRTRLARADLRRATGYVIHPGENDVKGLRVSRESAAGMLEPFGVEIE